MDDRTKALAEAMFRSGFSNPQAEGVDRAWADQEAVEGYRAEILLGLLHGAGYDVVKR